ncbi:TadE/TadG family type IV pilus assembly protein [Roseibium sediminis]|uniref:TadE/TadG family type IV pilus assembly protein n=1 Tax=Roseibium sediminis TaxID=1775174 RepID=UPI00123C9828|nr:TadE/TadG family type IV pilus assembly protein [Roseibium sediminis]
MPRDRTGKKVASKPLSLLRKAFRRYSRDDQGVTAIEFGIVGLPFFMLIFGILEFGLAFFVNRIVDNAVLEASRLVRTGQGQAFSVNIFRDKLCANMPVLPCGAGKVQIKVDKIKTFYDGKDFDSLPPMLDKDGKPTGDQYASNIGRSEIVAVRVMYRWPMFSSILKFGPGDSSGERLLYSTHIFRTEPW